MPSRPSEERPAPGLVWEWSDALFGAVIAVPAAVAATGDVTRGLAFAVGVIPAAVAGVAPQRRRRWLTALIGALAGVSITIGSLLSYAPIVAVAVIFALGVGAATLAGRSPAGRLVMVLALPLVGVGLSYSDLTEAAGIGAVMAVGSVWAVLVALLWPEHDAPSPAPPPHVEGMLGYGVRLGLAAATTATAGFVLDLDHVGWACAAALLVMRPVAQMLERRAVGRLVSVALGATCAGIAASLDLASWAYGVVVLVAIAACAATHRSRWYVTSTFTTFLALSLIVHSDPATSGQRWVERVAETALGVAAAYLFGVVVPAVTRRRPPRAAG